MVPVASNRRESSSVTALRLALATGRTYDKLGPSGAEPAQGPVVELGKAPKSKGRPSAPPAREPSLERSSLSDKVRQWVERGLPIGVLVVALIGAPVMIFSPEGLPRLRGLERELAAVEGGAQGCNLRRPLFSVAPERQRPDAGVDHQGHRRERSAL